MLGDRRSPVQSSGARCYYTFSMSCSVDSVVFIINVGKTEDRLIRYLLWASLSVSAGAFDSNPRQHMWIAGIVT